MLFLCTMFGVVIHIAYNWNIEFQRTEKRGQNLKKWKKWAFTQINEWVMTFIGAILWLMSGENIFYFAMSKAGFTDDEQVDILVNNEELIYVLGGALFGVLLMKGFKYGAKKVNNKLNN